MHIKYDDLKIQEYFVGGYCSKKISKLIFKARSCILDIKTQQSWKYADKSRIGCEVNEESGEELLNCEKLKKQKNAEEFTVILLKLQRSCRIG